mmetsp:Transcript_66689/g.164352  ORF Transcript_66689/g.164352 Transcript_66689/m.164352 type:complete len:504 (-) Transcript_66689:1692-3203(-)
MLAKIRRMHLRDGLSIREVSRRTGLSRNTVRQWLRQEGVTEPKYPKRETASAVDAWAEHLASALKADQHRPVRDRRTVKMLFEQIRALGYAGSYARVTRWVRAWRAEQDAAPRRAAFVPMSFELGDAFQFDWSCEYVFVGGLRRRLEVAHTKLASSRAFWLTAYPTQSHEMLFDAHTRGFAALGGVARRGIYDNMKTAVDRVGRGKHRDVNSRFAALCAHYLFDPDFCNVASGWEKGVVEKNVQDSRRRVWLDAARQRFGSFTELNAWLAERCRALWSELRHPEHSAFSVAEMLEHERANLLPVAQPFDGYVERMARVSSTCLVSVARNRYSVPCEWVGQMVSTRLYPGQVVIVADDGVMARHERLSNKGETRYDWQHYIPLVQRKPGALRNGAPFQDLPEPLQRLRRVLLREAGGDRAMAQVLALVPSAGLEAVLVAVELALEGASPSGRVSLEHVANVLARLSGAASPQSAATSLKARTPPLADTARYDRLRTGVQEADHA